MEPTTFYLQSLGCPKNRVDSEVILGALINGGHKPVEDPLQARLIVVNTCSFIESATQESIDTILELAQAKQRGQCKFFVVAGCLPQRYGRKLANSMPEVDLFVGTSSFARLPSLLAPSEGGSGKTQYRIHQFFDDLGNSTSSFYSLLQWLPQDCGRLQ